MTLTAPACPAIFGGMGFSEMLMIAFVSILVFGGRLPEVMRNLGQAYARIRRSLTEMSAPIRHEIERATTLAPDSVAPAPHPAHPEVPSVPYGMGTSEPYEPTQDGAHDTAHDTAHDPLHDPAVPTHPSAEGAPSHASPRAPLSPWPSPPPGGLPPAPPASRTLDLDEPPPV